MAYTKQTWIAPTGTGLSRYAKIGETSTHIELALDPVNLTNTPTPITAARLNHMEDGIAEAIKRHGNTWFAKTWAGLTDFRGSYIWTDGENIYYSFETSQYVLNKATSTWEAKTWTGLTSFYGSYIWTDGENIYYSNLTNQYVLNKTTSTWEAKTWTGLTSFYGSYIWTDGENIYYSHGATGQVLNKATNTWEVKTWTGLTNFRGSRIWTDGENIYYSHGATGQVLNKATNTWEVKTWTGLTDFNGEYIWTDGENIYYSFETSQYVLNKATSTWEAKTWTGLTDFNGEHIWTDGENIYYSNGTAQYVLTDTIKANVIGNADTATNLATAISANDSRVKTALNASGEAPIYACRAWVNFNGTGTVAIRASGNVSSITDNGTGTYTVNFTTAMSDANYSLHITGSSNTGRTQSCNQVSQTTTGVKTAFRVSSGSEYDQLEDNNYALVSVFR